MLFFLDKRVRAAWDESRSRWLYSARDVMEIIAPTKNPSRYWSDLKRKNKNFSRFGKIVRLKLISKKDGKAYLTDAVSKKMLLRIIAVMKTPIAKQISDWQNTGETPCTDILPEPLALLIEYNPANRVLLKAKGLRKTAQTVKADETKKPRETVKRAWKKNEKSAAQTALFPVTLRLLRASAGFNERAFAFGYSISV